MIMQSASFWYQKERQGRARGRKRLTKAGHIVEHALRGYGVRGTLPWPRNIQPFTPLFDIRTRLIGLCIFFKCLCTRFSTVARLIHVFPAKFDFLNLILRFVKKHMRYYVIPTNYVLKMTNNLQLINQRDNCSAFCKSFYEFNDLRYYFQTNIINKDKLAILIR